MIVRHLVLARQHLHQMVVAVHFGRQVNFGVGNLLLGQLMDLLSVADLPEIEQLEPHFFVQFLLLLVQKALTPCLLGSEVVVNSVVGNQMVPHVLNVVLDAPPLGSELVSQTAEYLVTLESPLFFTKLKV